MRLRHLLEGEPVVLTWQLFLWGYIVPMALIVGSVVGGFAYAVNQRVDDIHELRRENRQLAAAFARSDLLLCRASRRVQVRIHIQPQPRDCERLPKWPSR